MGCLATFESFAVSELHISRIGIIFQTPKLILPYNSSGRKQLSKPGFAPKSRGRQGFCLSILMQTSASAWRQAAGPITSLYYLDYSTKSDIHSRNCNTTAKVTDQSQEQAGPELHVSKLRRDQGMASR